MYAEYQAETYFLLNGSEGHTPDDDALHARAGDVQKSASDESGCLDASKNEPHQYRVIHQAS